MTTGLTITSDDDGYNANDIAPADPGGSGTNWVWAYMAKDETPDDVPAGTTEVEDITQVNDTCLRLYTSAADETDRTFGVADNTEHRALIFEYDDEDGAGSIKSNIVEYVSTATTKTPPTLTTPGADFLCVVILAHLSGTFTGNTGETDYTEQYDEDIGPVGWWAADIFVESFLVTGNTGDYTPGDITCSSQYGGMCVTFSIPTAASDPTIAQEGFRLYDDDATPDSATALAAQDTAVTDRATAATTIARAILDATNDPATNAFKIQWNYDGDPDALFEDLGT